MIKAAWDTMIEQKYMEHRIDKDEEYNESIDGIPGDIKVNDYFRDRVNKSAYFDVTVANVFATSYIKNTSKERLWLSKRKELIKHKKCKNDQNVIPLAIETMGATGPECKRLLQRLADALSLRTNTPYSIMMQ